MLIFDQLKKNDPSLRLLATGVFGGMAVLFLGLWWVQVVSGRYYEAKLETQSYRTVRVPAPRGRILDRNGAPLAENQPSYNLSLYLEEFSPVFQRAFNTRIAAYKKSGIKLKREQRSELARATRYAVASNVVAQVADEFQETVTLDPVKFKKHYETDLALPLTVLPNLTPAQIARVEEHPNLPAGLDVDIQAARFYPNGPMAAHLLGYVRRDDSSAEGEEAFFNHRLPDFRGIVGIEAAFDQKLRGEAGAKSVLVNNLGYRQSENILTPVEPGQNLVLTIDLAVQQAAERALQCYGPKTRGAVVVMDPKSGDILALASSPVFDPNGFVRGITHEQWEQLSDERQRPQINRALQENYAPGSIFKTVVALAALENGLNPAEIYNVQPDPVRAGRGCIYIGRRKVEDTAPPGPYDFRRALKLSSNAYFINAGLRAGISNIVQLGARLHLGERTGLLTRGQETPGIFPKPNRIRSGWMDGDTANACIGQGEINVTPVQMAVLTSALANGGKVLWPRLVDRIEPLAATGQPATTFSAGRVRDNLGVKPRSLEIIRDAMRADVEDSDGTGRAAQIPGFRVCGKTGTAQIMNERNQVTDHTTWFISFAPYENPRYTVVVMVESGGSGGGTCAPIAKEIYLALQKREQKPKQPRATTLAQNTELNPRITRMAAN